MPKTTKDVVTSQPQPPTSSKKGVSRRRALKTIAAAGGAVAVTKWAKPVVDAVVLPAHAQATGLSISCSASADGTPINNGDSVPVGTPMVLVATVTPNPGAGLVVAVELLCNGTVVDSDTDTTDANGQISTTGNAGDVCSGPGNEEARVTVGGSTASCSWVAVSDED